jgi:hypothetical protein
VKIPNKDHHDMPRLRNVAGRKPNTAESRLTKRQAQFVAEYLRDHNGLQAAIRAGYSRRGAAVIASKTLMLANVATAIDAEMQKLAERNRVTLDSLISEAEAARQLAMQLGQCSAAIAAVREIGILSGLRIQRSERLQRNINDLTDDELIAIAQGESSTIELEAGEVSWSTQRAIAGRKQ